MPSSMKSSTVHNRGVEGEAILKLKEVRISVWALLCVHCIIMTLVYVCGHNYYGISVYVCVCGHYYVHCISA